MNNYSTFKMMKIVHLDMKGAPMKVDYLEKVFQVIKSWGVTGVLLEWEDTFPYTGELDEIGSVKNAGGDNLYSLAEVKHLLACIKELGMEAIQLVQTFGHMEFVLKHPAFRELREIEQAPAVMCPTKLKSLQLVMAMVDQALEVQPDATFFHIGADEVWHAGICEDCQAKLGEDKMTKAKLYLEHIKRVVLHVKSRMPNISVLMWDDMLRPMDAETLREYAIGDLAIPVIWHYSTMECFGLTKEMFNIYTQLFPKVFVGTAFKGANGSCQVLSPAARYVSNHEAWLSHMKENERVNFIGVILTGWSRYDHYATLCELLPVALPSLASCLKVLHRDNDGIPMGCRRFTRRRICRARPISLAGTDLDPGSYAKHALCEDILPSHEWPGEEVARSIHSFVILRERAIGLLTSEMVRTWLNPWQIARRYTVPVHVEGIRVTAHHILGELIVLKADLTNSLLRMTGERSTDEWIHSYIEPLITKVTRLCRIADERVVCEAGVKPL
ncbi:hexosaminidase D-like isoform X3 [Spodoptera litura]|uniref:Hexosaminidase D-like isoform X3 n=1 Tax=Spodoptera litura TaxID=69820 RepID=A0A9J7IY06_SPOLT|nr:hexosaminidase D-like isoform X3 [Spodoptera litura]